MTSVETSEMTQAEHFYLSALEALKGSGAPFMVGGAYAMRLYADINRDTKDLDIFCKAGDATRMLQALTGAGYTTEVTDANWLAKAFNGENFVDLIFNSRNGVCPVDDTWFEHARPTKLFDCEVLLIPPEEELWTKVYVQDRHRFDGADVAHIIRKSGAELDWERILLRLEVHWELLLQQLILFRFVYPSEHDKVPQWVMEELLSRMQRQVELPAPKDRICRGGLLSQHQFDPDILEWGYKAT